VKKVFREEQNMRKRNWRNTFGAKTVATVLSAAMAFSGLSAGMPAATAMAEDGQEQTEGAVAVSAEASSEASSEEDSEQVSATEASSEASSEASAEASSEEAAKGSSEEKSSEEKPEEETAPEVEGTGRSFDDSKIDAWDFGAESLGDSYNNRLDVTTSQFKFIGNTGMPQTVKDYRRKIVFSNQLLKAFVYL
jgi:predicted alpha/beta hydrolase family esterase